MVDVDVLLSDDFVQFSSKVAELHEKKKKLNADFKKLYEEHKKSLKTIDGEAAKLQKEFEVMQSPEEEEAPPQKKGK
jgi:uncharacterized protein (UPF0335 family)